MWQGRESPVTDRKPDRTSGVSRRRFLRGAAAAAFAAPHVITSSALGQNGVPPASDRIVMAAIGVGGMGMGNLRGFLGRSQVQVVAVCDVDGDHLDEAKRTVDERYGNTDCAAYVDFREVIARGDVDAIFTALPDHWHAIPAIQAARAGIDIYGEKPLARTIREGRAICDAVQRYGRIWQTGSWQRSVGSFRRASELVRNDRLGKVHMIEVGLPGSGRTGVRPPEPVPPQLDWDMWLGPAPWAEYTPARCHFQWRNLLDYSGGGLTDWGGHHIDIAHWAMDLDHTGPVWVEGVGEYPTEGLYDVPSGYRFDCKYASGLTMTVADTGKIEMGTRWYGDRGWIHVNRQRLTAEPESLLEEQIGPGETHLYVSNNHSGNFLDCIRSRRQTITPAETAHRSISVAHLGEIAMRTGRRIYWNAETEEIIGDAAASSLLGRAYREPWYL
jgi:predicted dehydrogenase